MEVGLKGQLFYFSPIRKVMMTFFVYILQSQTNLSFYKGTTDDLERRLSEHNAGKNIAYQKIFTVGAGLVWYQIN